MRSDSEELSHDVDNIRRKLKARTLRTQFHQAMCRFDFAKTSHALKAAHTTIFKLDGNHSVVWLCFF